MTKKTLFRVGTAGLVLLLVILVAGFWYVSGSPAHPDRQGVVRVTVPHGATAWKTGRLLASEGLIGSARRFVWYLKWKGHSADLRAGTYDIPRSASMASMARQLLAGDEVEVSLTFPEGWTAARMAGEYGRSGVCDSTVFMRTVHDTSLIHSLGMDVPTLEGFLYPETYVYRLNLDPREVVSAMVAVFREKVGPEWLKQAKASKLGLLGTVTLASIVQGEFKDSTEAPDIAALYSNRLRKGMKLQADPTIQYILPGQPRRLLLKDLRIRSPYNTYLYKGLPPGPINNPGLTALKAALHPPKRPWLYMVAKGNGRHTFSITYAEHQKAKRVLDRIRWREAHKRGNRK